MSALRAIMNMEGCSKKEAKEIMDEIREEICENPSIPPEDILQEYELEPDYIFEFI